MGQSLRVRHIRMERTNDARIEIMTGDWVSYRVFDGGEYGEWIKLDSYRDLEQTLRKIITE